MSPDTLDRARAFLASKRIALVGVSRNEKDFSRVLFRELLRRGYDVVPVNPARGEIEGHRVYAAISDVTPRVEAALLLTPRSATDAVLTDALRAKVRKVWLHRGAGEGSATPTAFALCKANGIEVVHDLCPFMVLSGAALPHRLHAFFRLHFGRPVQAPYA